MSVTSKKAIYSIPSLAFSITLGFIVWFVIPSSHWVDPLIVALCCGIIFRTLLSKNSKFIERFNIVPSLLIPPGIILYAANISIDSRVLSPSVWLQIMIGLIIVVWLASFLGRLFKIKNSLYLLIAVGTAICGASAILISKSAVNADEKDTTSALIVTTLWGLVGLFLLPLIASFLGMDIEMQARLYATTLHQTGIVKAAALTAGIDCQTAALIIKAARTVTIIPLLVVVSSLYNFPLLVKEEEEEEEEPRPKIKIPWYLWAFLISSIIFVIFTPSKPYIHIMKTTSTIVWTMAMVAIGLTADIKEVIKTLPRPIILGFVIWIALLVVFFYTYINKAF